MKHFFITHWHDDHIRGASQVLARCKQAKFWCSSAIGTGDFFTLVCLSKGSGMASSGVDEFRAILEILSQRKPSGVRSAAVGPEWLLAGMSPVSYRPTLWMRGVRILALSPSAASLTLAYRQIANLLPREGEDRRRVVRQSPNQSSLVLSVESKWFRAILGADLENSANPAVGWGAIVQSHRPNLDLADQLKVPHHGSRNADNPEVWRVLLKKNPIAVVTPNSALRQPLPTPADVARIRRRTNRGFCTSRPGGRKPTTRGGAIDKTADSVAKNRRTVLGSMGHVRCRIGAGWVRTAPRIELLSGAYPLE